MKAMVEYEDDHYPMLMDWWEKRGMGMTPEERLPEIGYIVPEVAAGFLYQTDSDIALIEGLISNPETDGFTRHGALDAIVDALAEKAKELGFKTLYGFTRQRAVARRAERHGYDSNGAFVLYVKEV